MSKQKVAFVTGSSGFIGGHLVKALKDKGYYVIGADIELPKYEEPDVFYQYDLRLQKSCIEIFENYPEISECFNLGCLMGGMGWIGCDEHEFDIVIGSSLIVANITDACVKYGVEKLFYSSSACCYNMALQESSDCNSLKESDSYPAMPDLPYGWQKLFSEQMCKAAKVSKGLDVRIARFHNIFGEYGIYDGGKEKAPSAIARKVAMAKDGDEIEVWGTGLQKRSFLHISECLEGVFKLMDSDYTEPINIGSSESVTINQLAQMVIDISGKKLTIKNVESPFVGVQCRNSDNTLIEKTLGWNPTQKLEVGMRKLYEWVLSEVEKNK